MLYTVYRHYGASGTLLYIGSTTTTVRHLTHMRTSPWFRYVARTMYEHFDTHTDMINIEVWHIKNMKPLFNRAHNDSCSFRSYLAQRALKDRYSLLTLLPIVMSELFPHENIDYLNLWLVQNKIHPDIKQEIISAVHAHRDGKWS